MRVGEWEVRAGRWPSRTGKVLWLKEDRQSYSEGSGSHEECP